MRKAVAPEGQGLEGGQGLKGGQGIYEVVAEVETLELG